MTSTTTTLSVEQLRAAVFEAEDLGGELVPVPDWGPGVEFWVRGLTAAERNSVISHAREQHEDGSYGVNMDAYYALIVTFAVHHPVEHDVRVFTEADAPLLLQKSSKAVDKVANVAMRLSGMTKDDLQQAVEAAGKDSSSTGSDDSSSR